MRAGMRSAWSQKQLRQWWVFVFSFPPTIYLSMVELCLRYRYYYVGSGSLPRQIPLILPGVPHRFNLSPCGHITDTNGSTLKFPFQYNAMQAICSVVWLCLVSSFWPLSAMLCKWICTIYVFHSIRSPFSNDEVLDGDAGNSRPLAPPSFNS